MTLTPRRYDTGHHALSEPPSNTRVLTAYTPSQISFERDPELVSENGVGGNEHDVPNLLLLCNCKKRRRIKLGTIKSKPKTQRPICTGSFPIISARTPFSHLRNARIALHHGVIALRSSLDLVRLHGMQDAQFVDQSFQNQNQNQNHHSQPARIKDACFPSPTSSPRVMIETNPQPNRPRNRRFNKVHRVQKLLEIMYDTYAMHHRVSWTPCDQIAELLCCNGTLLGKPT